MIFLLTFHALKDLFPDHPHIQLVADVAQLLVYALTLYLVWRAKHPRKGWRQLLLTAFALLFPEIFLLHHGLTRISMGEDSIFAPRTMSRELYDKMV